MAPVNLAGLYFGGAVVREIDKISIPSKRKKELLQ
jgi:hypothetical protein